MLYHRIQHLVQDFVFNGSDPDPLALKTVPNHYCNLGSGKMMKIFTFLKRPFSLHWITAEINFSYTEPSQNTVHSAYTEPLQKYIQLIMIERRWTFSFCLQLVIVELYHFGILHSLKTLTESRNIYIVVDLVCAELIPSLTQQKEKLVLRLLSERRNAFHVDSEWGKLCSDFQGLLQNIQRQR
jgi:hypothetical protein